MPTTTIVILSLIVSAFVVFGLVLAWAERQTRHLHRNVQTRTPEKAKSSPSLRVLQSDGSRRVSETIRG